jgi:hypothetical protein
MGIVFVVWDGPVPSGGGAASGSGANRMTSEKVWLWACDVVALLGCEDCIPHSRRSSIPKTQPTEIELLCLRLCQPNVLVLETAEPGDWRDAPDCLHWSLERSFLVQHGNHASH